MVSNQMKGKPETIHKGAAWRYVPRKKSTYNYSCTFHPNMKGELIVQ
jgi:plastocyanin